MTGAVCQVSGRVILCVEVCAIPGLKIETWGQGDSGNFFAIMPLTSPFGETLLTNIEEYLNKRHG